MNCRYLMFALACSLITASCSHGLSVDREKVAQNIASSSGMSYRIFDAGLFKLTSYEKLQGSGDTATIYIEGDGLAWLSRTRVSLDPTPTNPLALRLAAIDDEPNVIWIARPCQYSKWNVEGKACPSKYWTGSRFAPEVIDSYNKALDELKQQYGFSKLNLVGYSGGGGVVALLAERRDDVVSLRTVAGNLDHEVWTEHHHVSPMDGSLNPVEQASTISNIPQLHFVGGKDEVVPELVFKSWLSKSGKSSCVKDYIVRGVGHNDGWVEQWRSLADIKPEC